MTWAQSLIRNEKPIVLFERNCHAIEKSEAVACARRCWPSQLTRWWNKKRIVGKKWRAKEEETHKGPLTPKTLYNDLQKCIEILLGTASLKSRPDAYIFLGNETAYIYT
jgi:hypothetical protein